MVFRRLWARLGRKQSAVSFGDVEEWLTSLREAADAELPATMDRHHRARLVLEVVDAMHRPDPLAAMYREPVRVNGHALSSTVESPLRPRPSGGRHRAEIIQGRPRHRAGGGNAFATRLRCASKRTRSIVIASVVAVLLGAVAFAMESSLHSSAPAGPGASFNTTLRVGVLPVVDVAPFYRALDEGYFAQEGLDVEAVTLQSGPAAIAELTAKHLDIGFATYPAILQAQSEERADLKIIAPAYTAKPGHLMLVAPPDGSILRAEDVGGKRIAVTGTGSISDLGAMSELSTRGVDLATIHWVPTPLPEMIAAMQRGDVDGAVLAEPYISVSDASYHARPILDIAVGKTARIPMSGWATRSELNSGDPDVYAGFARALQRGVDDVVDPVKREPVLIKYLNLDAATARNVRIAEFTKVLAPVEIQRVADLMKEFHVIGHTLDVGPMLLSR
jgi:NitT/TauT family transport system substrate-binding protein